MSDPTTIAVDLTPVLPGGENGGAKVFVLELLRRLAARHPTTRFVLLTHGASHKELASLDAANMERVVVAGANETARRAGWFARAILRRATAVLPRRVSIPLAALASRFVRTRPRGRSLRDRGVDLLFCPFTAPAYREAGLPLVATVYDLQYRTYPQFFRPEEVAHREQTFLSACRHASALIAISDYARLSAIECGPILPDRIRTVYLRMAQRIRSSDRTSAGGRLAALGVVAGEYFLYPANFWPHKNHEILLTAFGIAVQNRLSARLKLVCTGAPNERTAWLRRAAQAMGLGDRVLFPGYVDDDTLADLMTGARGLAFPSLYEGFGLPVIEAMAAGVPVACSASTSLPEVSAGAALLFDPRVPTDVAAALVTLDTDAATRARLIDAGRRRAAEFANSDRMADEYWTVFRFAVGVTRRVSTLFGVFADGWTGTQLSVEVAPAAVSRRLELEFCAPDWLPGGSVQVVARNRRAGDALSRIEVLAGGSALLELPVASQGASIEIDLGPGFVPRRAGIGDDGRELSLLLRRCSVAAADSTREILYPEPAQ
jgi:glycosyltransferase involved in cell wall biosynthesis